MMTFAVGDRVVGAGHPTFVIAEISANHNQSLSLAKETIAAAAEAQADAIKLQTYTPDTLTFNGDHESFLVADGTLWDGRTLYSLYEEGQTPWEWHAELFEYSRSLGMEAFSSPFDPTAVKFLSELDVPAYKIASFEIVDIPLIRTVAALGKPVIISTGIATEGDIVTAIEACRSAGNEQIALLKCTSAYPAELSELNLLTIRDMQTRFSCPVGYSDHTRSFTAAMAAVALGACIIERHLILDRAMGGLDSKFSTDAAEFAELVRLIRETETALGSSTYELPPRALASRRHARSLYLVKDVHAGDSVTEENVRSIRPANGLPPVVLPEIVGKAFAQDFSAGIPMTWDMLR